MASTISNKTDGFLLTWEIENINLSFFKERIVSPRFVAHNLYKSSWIMSLHSTSTRDSFCLNIECTEADAVLMDEIDVMLTVSVVTPNGKEIVLKEDEYFDFEIGSALKTVATFQNFKLTDDHLVFYCSMQKPDYYLTHEGRLRFPVKTLPFIRCAIHTFVGAEKRSGIWKVKDFANLLPDQQMKYKLLSTSPQSPEIELYGTISNKSKFHIEVHVLSEKRTFIVGQISVLTLNDDLKWSKVKGFLVDVSTSKMVFKFPMIISQRCELNELSCGDLNLLCEFSSSTGKMFSNISESSYIAKEHSHLLRKRMLNRSEPSSDVHMSNKKSYPEDDQFNYSAISKETPQTLKDDLKDFYLQKNHCDVTFLIESEKLPAHKSILCSRSPVFSAMFDSDMKETVSNEVEIMDIDADTLDRFLLFLYSETLEDLSWVKATKLLYAANKYQVESLKVMCSSFLMFNVSAANVCEALRLSDLYQDEKLQLICQNVIFSNESDIFSSAEWEVLTLENPMLSSKTLQSHFARKKYF